MASTTSGGNLGELKTPKLRPLTSLATPRVMREFFLSSLAIKELKTKKLSFRRSSPGRRLAGIVKGNVNAADVRCANPTPQTFACQSHIQLALLAYANFRWVYLANPTPLNNGHN